MYILYELTISLFNYTYIIIVIPFFNYYAVIHDVNYIAAEIFTELFNSYNFIIFSSI